MDVAGSSTANATSTPNSINDLPVEVLQNVFSFLDSDDLMSVATVCKWWNDAVNIVSLWKDYHWLVPTSATLKDVARFLTNIPVICNLKIEVREEDDDELMIETVIKCCKDIRSLDIGDIYADSGILESILNKFPNMESLTIALEQSETEIYMEKLGSFLCLQKLELCSDITMSIDLRPISDGCPQLDELNILQPLYNGEHFAYLLNQKKHKLKSLWFSTSGFSKETSFPLHECENLEHVTISFFSKVFPPDRILDQLSSLPVLKRLVLLHSDRVLPSSLTNLFHNLTSCSLVELDLSNYRNMCNDTAYAIKTRCPMIRKLYLNNCFKHQFSWLEKLLPLPYLMHFEARSCMYAEGWFRLLLQCHNLTYLDLDECYQLENTQALDLLIHLKLEYLNLSGCDHLTDDFIKTIPFCQSLKGLKILKCRFSYDCVENLKQRYPSVIFNIRCYERPLPEDISHPSFLW